MINLRGVDTFEHLSGISVILKVLRVFFINKEISRVILIILEFLVVFGYISSFQG